MAALADVLQNTPDGSQEAALQTLALLVQRWDTLSGLLQQELAQRTAASEGVAKSV
jgi:hypothetical protein